MWMPEAAAQHATEKSRADPDSKQVQKQSKSNASQLYDLHGANLLGQMRFYYLAHLATIGAQPGCLNLCLHGFHGGAHIFRTKGLSGERFFNQLFDLFFAGCLG